MSARVPPLAAREAPGLSVTLAGPRHPAHCMACGQTPASGVHGRALERWRECDPWDQPTASVVVLCQPCSSRLIEAHPRLYLPLEINEPCPGVMSLCQLCRYRHGLQCVHPAAKANGGPGLEIAIAEPTVMHVCRSPRSRSGFVTIWPSRATACAGREL